MFVLGQPRFHQADGDGGFFDDLDLGEDNEPDVTEEARTSESVSKEDFDKLQQELLKQQEATAKALKFQEALHNSLNPDAQKQLSNEEALDQVVINPVLQKVDERFEQNRQQAIVSRYRETYPEYANHEPAIIGIFGHLAREQQTKGIQPDFEKTLQAAVTKFQTDYGKDLTGKQQASRTPSFQLDVGYGQGQQTGKKLTPEAIWNMPKDSFDKLKSKVLNDQYQM